MKRIQRDRRLTPEEAAKYKRVRSQIAEELPELVAHHHDRMAGLDQLDILCAQLKAAREAKGLSLADVTELTGMDRSALSKLETGQRTIRRSRRLCVTPRRLENASWFHSRMRRKGLRVPQGILKDRGLTRASMLRFNVSIPIVESHFYIRAQCESFTRSKVQARWSNRSATRF